MSLSESIRALVSGKSPNPTRESAALKDIFRGDPNPVQVSAWLTALSIRGETPEILAALVEVMRSHAKPFPVPRHESGIPPLVDTCGTGGDNSGSFNVSTAAGLIAAASGGRVVKHGNRSASSRCGSADLLEAAGICLDPPPEVSARMLELFGFAFLYAREYHPAMRIVGKIRTDLGFRTVFNLLGPLSNPAKVKRQLLGVFSRVWVRPIAEALKTLGHEHALVVHGNGLDEIALDEPTYAFEVKDGTVKEFFIDPEKLPVRKASKSEFAGGDSSRNVEILWQILSGTKSSASEVSILNAGAVLYISGLAENLTEGIHKARATVETKKAAEHFSAMIDFQKKINEGSESV
ncbi:anthranilate phosphoribosyltransferase [bacterium]|nr:anthranilate phosphoribosyltransferase [bacterium]